MTWKKTLAYWSGVAAVMMADGDLGLDDVLIVLLAIPLYITLICRRK